MTEVALESTGLLEIEIQRVQEEAEGEEPPSNQALASWAESAYLAERDAPTNLTIRIVDEAEITELNRNYRGKDKPTNVLSFPFEIDPDIGLNLLGDIVICHKVVVQEATQQSKTVIAHYAHMVIHGVLHLCGHDHEEITEAERMEALEVKLLAHQGIASPY